MKYVLIGILCIVFAALMCTAEAQNRMADSNAPVQPGQPAPAEQIALGEPNVAGKMTVEQAISQQKNVRKFLPQELDAFELRQLAWAGQSIIATIGGQPAPENSVAPMDLYFCLWQGVFRYSSASNTLDSLTSIDVRSMLSAAVRNEPVLQEAPCVIVIAATVNPRATIPREQTRNIMMVAAGKISQNIALEAQSMGLATLGIGSLDIGRVKRIARLSTQQEPVYIVVAGHPASAAPQQTGRRQQRTLFIMPGSSSLDAVFGLMDVLDTAGIRTAVAQSGPALVRREAWQRAIDPNAMMRIQDVVANDYDAIIVVGGLGNPTFLREPMLLNIIRTAVQNGKIVGAIGEDTAALANAGVLGGVRITGDQRLLLNSGGNYTGNLVESDQGIVTALNANQTSLFGRAIIAALKGQVFQPPPTQQPVPPAPTTPPPMGQRMY